jgi:hypothetical protein
MVGLFDVAVPAGMDKQLFFLRKTEQQQAR